MTTALPADVVQIGDTVTVQFVGPTSKAEDLITVSGRVLRGPGLEGDLMVGRYIVAYSNGNPGPDFVCVTSRIPAEPPVGTVRKDNEGDYWVNLPDGWVMVSREYARSNSQTWAGITKDYTLEAVTA